MDRCCACRSSLSIGVFFNQIHFFQVDMSLLVSNPMYLRGNPAPRCTWTIADYTPQGDTTSTNVTEIKYIDKTGIERIHTTVYNVATATAAADVATLKAAIEALTGFHGTVTVTYVDRKLVVNITAGGVQMTHIKITEAGGASTPSHTLTYTKSNCL